MQNTAPAAVAFMMMIAACGGTSDDQISQPPAPTTNHEALRIASTSIVDSKHVGRVAKRVDLVVDDKNAADENAHADDTDTRGGKKVVDGIPIVDPVAGKKEQFPNVDPDLVNPWGLAFDRRGFAWTSANETGLGVAFNAAGKCLLRMRVPDLKNETSAPTGEVVNDDPTAFDGDELILVTEQGTIVGVHRRFCTRAVRRVDNSKEHAIYKGVAIARSYGRPMLYAADFHNGKIDVFDKHFKRVVNHGFRDDQLPRAFAPFGVFFYEGVLIVSYAKQDEDAEDDLRGPGNGFVDVFDRDGHFLDRLVSRGPLDSPWGFAVEEPEGHDTPRLFIGNFGDGRINVYRIAFHGLHLEAKFEGQVTDPSLRPIAIDGLWSIAFGSGAGGFDPNELYFTAGPGDGEHGILGKLVFFR